MSEKARPDRIVRRDSGQPVTTAPELISLGDSTLPRMENALQVLRAFFGHKYFRDDQRDTVSHLLAGQSGITVMATSAGKSLCYQLPAVVNFLRDDTTTVVISPLLALIRDQVDSLNHKDIPAAFFDSLQSAEQRAEQLKLVEEGVALLYVSPERLMTRSFQRDVLRMNSADPLKLAMIVVDECHAISHWGRNFRWSYGPKLRQFFAGLGRVQRFACTATAAAETFADIADVLGLEGEHFEIVGEIDRPNLEYSGRRFTSTKDQRDALCADIGSWQRALVDRESHKILIFVPTRNEAEDVSKLLRSKGIPVTHYHAGMERTDRLESQQSFAEGNISVMVATNAFGLGIDMPTIDRVIHLGLCGSIERYCQESGRAGRGGQRARCELWWQPEDLYHQAYFVRAGNPDRAFILRQCELLWSWVPEEQRKLPEPHLRVNLESFLPSEGQYRHLAGMRRAALTAMMAAGVLDLQGRDLVFLVKPDGWDEFLPSQSERDSELERARQALKCMLYYAQNVTQPEIGGVTGRRILLEELRHGTVVERIRAQDIRELVPIARERIVTILEYINREDRTVQGVIRAVLDGRLDTPSWLDSGTAPFAGVSNREVRAAVSHAAYCGFLRIYRRRHSKAHGRTSWLTLSQHGISELSKIMPENRQDLLRESTRWERVAKRIGHAAERPALQRALQNWKEATQPKVQNDSDLRRLLKSSFSKRVFHIADSDLTGEQLTRAFVKRHPREPVHLRDMRLLINYLFPDFIDQLADRRQLRGY